MTFMQQAMTCIGGALAILICSTLAEPPSALADDAAAATESGRILSQSTKPEPKALNIGGPETPKHANRFERPLGVPFSRGITLIRLSNADLIDLKNAQIQTGFDALDWNVGLAPNAASASIRLLQLARSTSNEAGTEGSLVFSFSLAKGMPNHPDVPGEFRDSGYWQIASNESQAFSRSFSIEYGLTQNLSVGGYYAESELVNGFGSVTNTSRTAMIAIAYDIPE